MIERSIDRGYSMKITQEIDYAFRVINYLMRDSERVTGANEISEQMHIPLRFLLKILRKLNAAGLTCSKRGVKGGYMLCDPRFPITYLEIVEAVQGPIVFNRCLTEGFCCENNSNGNFCEVHGGFNRVQKSIKEALEREKIVPKTPK